MVGILKMDLPPITAELEVLKVDKPKFQLNEEIIAEIDSLHEPRLSMNDKYVTAGLLVCAECWTTWPCATHRAIYGENKDSCTHHLTPAPQQV